MGRAWLWLLAGVVAQGCGGPATPDRPLKFSHTAFLQIDVAASCAAGKAALPVRHFEWVVGSAGKNSGQARFTLPDIPDPLGLDGLVLVIEGDADDLRGELSGRARVNRREVFGEYHVDFGDPEGVRLAGHEYRDATGERLTMTGTLEGEIELAIFATDVSFRCNAADHRWTLREL